MTKVMIVDDEALMRRGLQSLIDWPSLGCEVAAVEENGLQAKLDFDRVRPQIVISDIKMPVMDGLELAKWLSQTHAGTKVVLLTAFADFTYAQQAIEYGVSNYVTKTGNMEDIAAAVRKCQAQLAGEQTREAARALQIAELLRSVLDGTLQKQSEIEARAAACGLQPESFTLLMAETDPGEADAPSRFREQAARLLAGQLAGKAVCSVPVGQTRLCLLLPDAGPEELELPAVESAKLCAKMTHRSLYLGLSLRRRGMGALPDAVREAGAALSLSFYDEKPVHLYAAAPQRKQEPHARCFDALSEALKTGSGPESAAALQALFDAQQTARQPDSLVREECRLVFSVCRRALDRVGLGMEDLDLDEAEWQREIGRMRLFRDCCAQQLLLVQSVCREIACTLETGGDLIADTLNYIERHYREPVTLRDAAAAVHVSAGYLSRYFKQKTGSNVMDAIAERKVEQAKKLLAENRCRIYEIAQQLGFEDTTYFSHVFRKYTGMSPKAYQDSLTH